MSANEPRTDPLQGGKQVSDQVLTLEHVARLTRRIIGEPIVAVITSENHGYVAAYRPSRGEERAYSSHAVYARDRDHGGLEAGHYEMTREEALADVVKRAGILVTELNPIETGE